MPTVPSSTLPVAAKPSRLIFDPFNSSATGHQRADNRLSGSTSWRESRNLKLRSQFSSGRGGGERVSDTVGAGSKDFGRDGRTENGGFVAGASGLRGEGQRSLWEVRQGVKVEKGRDGSDERAGKRRRLEGVDEKATKVVNPWTPFRREDGKIRETSWPSHHDQTKQDQPDPSPSDLLSPIDPHTSSAPNPSPALNQSPETLPNDSTNALDEDKPPPQIFRACHFYINGSTYPAISDHALKHLIATHGGTHSISLGRKTVTHVIICKPATGSGSSSTEAGPTACGGGLAGSKIHKEMSKSLGRGSSVKYVSVAWVTESVKAGKRLAETKFEALRMAGVKEGSVRGMFGVKEK